MRKTVFSQLNPRWANLPYPNKQYTIKSSGCGCCSVANIIIESEKYKKYTPKNVQPYMIQYAVPAQGTRWVGITKGLEHYGFKAVNHDTMQDLFKTLKERKRRLGILLFKAGSKGGITWTTSGHYVAFTDYKVKNGRHYFYVKDSGGRNNTGWYCFETQMKNLIVQCWSAKLPHTNGYKIRVKARQLFAAMTKLKFKYKVSGNADSWTKAKKQGHRTSNCATYVSYVLQAMGLLKEGQLFWCNDGVVKYKGKGTKAQLAKIADIYHIHKAPKKAKLRKGDICGYSKPAHTQIFAGYDAKGNALWYSFGPTDIGKKLPRKRGKYNTKKIDTVIRLKP